MKKILFLIAINMLALPVLAEGNTGGAVLIYLFFAVALVVLITGILTYAFSSYKTLGLFLILLPFGIVAGIMYLLTNF